MIHVSGFSVSVWCWKIHLLDMNLRDSTAVASCWIGWQVCLQGSTSLPGHVVELRLHHLPFVNDMHMQQVSAMPRMDCFSHFWKQLLTSLNSAWLCPSLEIRSEGCKI